MTQIYDITVTLSEKLHYWPEDPQPNFERVLKMEEGASANLTHINMCAHTGTHVDAPCHFLKGEKGVDTLPLEVLIGKTQVIAIKEPQHLTADLLAAYPIQEKRVLFKTQNAEKWEKPSFQNDYLAVEESGACYLVEKGIQLVGIDYLSIAPFSNSAPTHQTLLKAGVVILEGLTLAHVPEGIYTLYCLPLKIKGADGAPARVVLVKN